MHECAQNMQNMCKNMHKYEKKICRKYALNMRNIHKSMQWHIFIHALSLALHSKLCRWMVTAVPALSALAAAF